MTVTTKRCIWYCPFENYRIENNFNLALFKASNFCFIVFLIKTRNTNVHTREQNSSREQQVPCWNVFYEGLAVP